MAGGGYVRKVRQQTSRPHVTRVRFGARAYSCARECLEVVCERFEFARQQEAPLGCPQAASSSWRNASLPFLPQIQHASHLNNRRTGNRAQKAPSASCALSPCSAASPLFAGPMLATSDGAAIDDGSLFAATAAVPPPLSMVLAGSRRPSARRPKQALTGSGSAKHTPNCDADTLISLLPSA